MSTPPRRIFGPDHQAFRDSVKGFLAAEVEPHLTRWRAGEGVPREMVVRAGELGFLGIATSEEFGGAGVDDFGFLAVLVEETVAAGSAGLALLWALAVGVTMPLLNDYGTDDDRRRWLPELCAGRSLGVPAPADLTGIVGGTVADLVLAPHLDAVGLLDIDRPGVSVTRVATLAGREAGLADVAAGGNDPQGALPAWAMRRDLNMWLAVVALAGARAAVDLALDYAQNRTVFGRPLAEFENTRFRLAELSAELRVAGVFTDTCLQDRSAGELSPADAAAARLQAIALHGRAADQSLQLHGGYGYMREYPVSEAFADAWLVRSVASAYSDARTELIGDLLPAVSAT